MILQIRDLFDLCFCATTFHRFTHEAAPAHTSFSGRTCTRSYHGPPATWCNSKAIKHTQTISSKRATSCAAENTKPVNSPEGDFQNEKKMFYDTTSQNRTQSPEVGRNRKIVAGHSGTISALRLASYRHVCTSRKLSDQYYKHTFMPLCSGEDMHTVRLSQTVATTERNDAALPCGRFQACLESNPKPRMNLNSPSEDDCPSNVSHFVLKWRFAPSDWK